MPQLFASLVGSLIRIFDHPRLSTPPVLVRDRDRDRDQARGRYLAIGHYRSGHALYSHFWYEMQVSALRMTHWLLASSGECPTHGQWWLASSGECPTHGPL